MSQNPINKLRLAGTILMMLAGVFVITFLLMLGVQWVLS